MFRVALDFHTHVLEPAWHCVETLAMVLKQNSHSFGVLIISISKLDHTAVRLGQCGELQTAMEEANRNSLISVTGKKEGVCTFMRTAPACTQKLHLRAVFSNQRARVVALLC